jgi:hypothetical protein
MKKYSHIKLVISLTPTSPIKVCHTFCILCVGVLNAMKINKANESGVISEHSKRCDAMRCHESKVEVNEKRKLI